MCIFTEAVEHVERTRIFARGDGGPLQFLVYSMNYAARSELAMVLPLPTPPSPPEAAVRIIDLSGYPEFFRDLEQGFVIRHSVVTLSADDEPRLAVHEVGSYEASFVPRAEDFTRLDPRFRIPDQVFRELPRYAEFAFAVFKLKPGRRDVHPMAFAFPRRDPSRLFFPTVHVHDGTVHEEARFDHELYCQPIGNGPHPQEAFATGWQESSVRWIDDDDNSFELHLEKRLTAAEFMNVEKARGVIAPDLGVFSLRLEGTLRNEDVVVADRMPSAA